MSQMRYQGYTAHVEYDAEDRIFVGRIADIGDIAVFHGASVDELETAFHDTVDHYLAVSARTGIPAQVPAAADLTLRLSSDVHGGGRVRRRGRGHQHRPMGGGAARGGRAAAGGLAVVGSAQRERCPTMVTPAGIRLTRSGTGAYGGKELPYQRMPQ